MRESVSLVLAKSDNVPPHPPVWVVSVFLGDQGDMRILSKSQILGWLESLVTRSDVNEPHRGRDCSSTVRRSSYFLSASPTQML